ncbi:BON domain-containing protein [Botrimarina mediterranea]|uniref:BON domain-containing protein n=1 Tax=Botrimarina mediterranea TaxID=2528022 RepID=A0A518K7M0_9BACT|nr:BON domain-containing protein [Botrimarina mediterranea]QDV73776.1 hypothetical protein Spa11_19750 [Botrimarina mediterranea]QDV78422.1 hypothetical protein K2D_20290 [Planctomycetes bacterium K2D]
MDNKQRVLAAMFQSSGYAELGKLEIDFTEHGRVLVLRGRVSSYYIKQRAQEIGKLMEGVQQIVNKLGVVVRMPLAETGRRS